MDTTTKVYKKISIICEWNPKLDAYIYENTLDKFVVEYGEKFMFLPSEDVEYDVLAITNHHNFGQC